MHRLDSVAKLVKRRLSLPSTLRAQILSGPRGARACVCVCVGGVIIFNKERAEKLCNLLIIKTGLEITKVAFYLRKCNLV